MKPFKRVSDLTLSEVGAEWAGQSKFSKQEICANSVKIVTFFRKITKITERLGGLLSDPHSYDVLAVEVTFYSRAKTNISQIQKHFKKHDLVQLEAAKDQK